MSGATVATVASYATIAGAAFSVANATGVLGGKPKAARPAAVSAPAPLPAASPARDASSEVAASASNQRAKALVAAGSDGANNPDLAGAPQTAKSNLLGPS